MSALQTLDRGLRALEIVSLAPAGISVADLARELDVHRAICYRIVSTLESRGMVSRTEDGRIRLAVGVAVLASRFEPQLRDELRALLRRLAEGARATAFLSAADGPDCVVLMVTEPTGELLTVGYRVGSRHPLTRGAAGIAILAARPERPEDTDEVRAARRDGYSVTRAQLEQGATGVATGIRVRSGVDGGALIERSIGVVAIDGLDLDRAVEVVRRSGVELAGLFGVADGGS
ncbi:IclR family transcriptional regulator [Stackebrandtia soli]|uniref:IclR family transcriptional regulator n=1 Tax=Stackebrandtia soli TaxID=1892856 RepID=UPI0039ED062A